MRVFCAFQTVLTTLSLIICIFAVQPTSADAYVCGNGVRELGEVCDHGSQNSDSQANACRTDCRAAYCGDGVLDSGEECDASQANAPAMGPSDVDTIPNSCRNGCKLPVCGDGIRDNGSYAGAHVANKSNVFTEECDDGNNNDIDGCKSDCTTCTQLSSNIDVTADTKLCGQVFSLADYGDEGVLIAKFPGVTIDCDGATLQGTGVGAGIYVKMSNDVTIKNCTVTGYAVGIKIVDSQNVHFAGYGNNLSGNTETIVLDNSQIAPPKPMQSVVGGMVGGRNLPITQQGQPQPEGQKKLQPGGSFQGLAKPGAVGGRSNLLPGRQPTIRKPGKPVAPLGTSSSGRGTVKGLSPAPAPLGHKIIPPAPLGTKSMPPDPMGTTKKMPIDPLGTQGMPIDPYDTKKIPSGAPAIKQPISIVR